MQMIYSSNIVTIENASEKSKFILTTTQSLFVKYFVTSKLEVAKINKLEVRKFGQLSCKRVKVHVVIYGRHAS